MTHKSSFFIILAVVIFYLTGCSRSSDNKVDIVRLDKVLSGFDNLSFERQLEVADSLHPEIDAMFQVLGVDSPTIETLSDWSQSQVVRVFQPDVDSIFPNISDLQSNIGYIVDQAHADSLRLPSGLRFATVTWGNPRPIVRVDSIILIALNHYLGLDYPGYEKWQQFRRYEKSPQQLPYDIAAVLAATQYPMQNGVSTTMLSWMLYEGTLVEARMRLVKDADVVRALGYTPEQYKYLEENCKKIWDEMALRKLIYETDPTVIDRYFAAAPSTPLLNSTSPGRVGRYIGYKIVRSFIKSHPGVGLPYLLSKDFYGSQQSLVDSKFNGR